MMLILIMLILMMLVLVMLMLIMMPMLRVYARDNDVNCYGYTLHSLPNFRAVSKFTIFNTFIYHNVMFVNDL